jgi:hypothetical protein
MADDKKVFDVAKPGSSKPDTGSKPMVVGHKIMKDPTLTDSENEPTKELASQANKITLSPISHDNETTRTNLDKSIVIDEENPAEGSASESIATNDPVVTPTTDTSLVSPEEESQPVQSAEQRQEVADIEQVEQEENLQRIIKEKTYFVPIEEASYSAFKTFVKTFIVAGVVGLLIVFVLIDAEIINLGIELPFDFL